MKKLVQVYIKSNKLILTTLIASTFLLWFYYNSLDFSGTLDIQHEERNLMKFLYHENQSFIAIDQKCRIPNIEPINAAAVLQLENYKFCRDRPLLTTVIKRGEDSFLVIDENAAAYYKNLYCCYAAVKRSGTAKDFDNAI